MNQMREMILHPWSYLRRVYGLDRKPGSGPATIHPRYPYDKRQSDDPLEKGRGLSSWANEIFGIGLGQELTRLQLYTIYKEMDTDPLITSVLDAFAEDATQRDYERGRTVWCESKNDQVQGLVTKCLDRIGIEDIAFAIVRSFVKYGDTFEKVCLSRNDGVTSLRPYDQWDVARMEDTDGRLNGFAPSDGEGNAHAPDQYAVAPYKCLHYRLLGRERKDIYGSSILWGSRTLWRQLQLMQDKLVLQRLLRRPDRLLILMDMGGMPLAESFDECKRWEQRLYKEYNIDPASGLFSSQRRLPHEAMDVVLPLGVDNNTRIETIPATQGNDLLRDFDLIISRLLGGLHVPKGYFGFEGAYEANMSLGKQDVRFAKTVMRCQRAFLIELVRLCMIDLAFQSVDPFADENAFRLQITPVSAFMEIERSELLQMRFDLMDRLLRLGADMGLDKTVWNAYIMREIGQFPQSMIDELAAKAPQEGGGEFESMDDGLKKALDEEVEQALEEDPEKALALTFLSEGMGRVNNMDSAITGARSGKGWTPESAEKETTLVEEIKGLKELDDEAFLEKSAIELSEAPRQSMRKEAKKIAERRVKVLFGLASLTN